MNEYVSGLKNKFGYSDELSEFLSVLESVLCYDQRSVGLLLEVYPI